MKLQVAPYNNGATTWTEAEETALRTYTINHRFNRPAEATITLADPTGAILRKYNADANDVFLGVGKVTIEDPDGTDIFYGRIKRVIANTADRTITLECKDWLDQLDDEKITYDMREKIGAGDMRQSTAYADKDGGVVAAVWNGVLLKGAIADDGGVQSDDLTDALDAGANDMELLPALPVINDAYYWGFHYPVPSFKLNNGLEAEWVGTLAWEYWDGSAWQALAGISDGTSRYTLPGVQTISWTLPADWAASDENGTVAYWMRARVSAFTSIDAPAAGTQVLTTGYYLFFDDNMVWANDVYNGMYLIFTAGMAGTRTWRFHPHDSTATGHDNYADDPEATWVNNDTVDTGFADNDWTLQYDFQTELGHNTPSDFYVNDSITAARLKCIHQISQLGGGNHGTIHIWDNNAAAWSAALSALSEDDVRTEMIHTIPLNILPYIVDATGLVKVLYDIDRTAGNATLAVHYLELDLDVTTTGYSSPVIINDTFNPNYLEVATDLTAQATQMWHGVPYCIAKPIYQHLESATGPILGGDTVVTLTAGAANIENTTGISTRQHKNKTRLDILKSEAIDDGAVFFIALGTSTVTYQKTFGAHSENMSDATVDSWQSVYDYGTMFNSIDVYGVQLGDYEIYQQSTNAASILKYRTSKNKIMSNAGLVTDTDALAIGTLLAARDNDIQQMIGCTISGRDDTYRLGTVVGITSSYLWAAAEKEYQVVAWSYDSNKHKTFLLLHPRSSIGMQEILTTDTDGRILKDTSKRTEQDLYIPDPITHEVS